MAHNHDLASDQLYTPGRYPGIVRARSVLCYLAVRELGLTATELARQMELTQPAISMSVKRGAEIVKGDQMRIDEFIT